MERKKKMKENAERKNDKSTEKESQIKRERKT